MSKALYGFLGGPDPRTQAELATLRARIRELEAELAALRAPASVELPADDLDLALLATPNAALV